VMTRFNLNYPLALAAVLGSNRLAVSKPRVNQSMGSLPAQRGSLQCRRLARREPIPILTWRNFQDAVRCAHGRGCGIGDQQPGCATANEDDFRQQRFQPRRHRSQKLSIRSEAHFFSRAESLTFRQLALSGAPVTQRVYQGE
jgi:hypothetical protein